MPYVSQEDLYKLLLAGDMLSNCAFNLSLREEDVPKKSNREDLAVLYRSWDRARSRVSESLKKQKETKPNA
jgi:hypothetical protein